MSRWREPAGVAMTSTDETRRLLLISNSTLHGSGYLDHAEKEIRDCVGDRTGVIFIPFAVHDWRTYAAKAHERFRDMGLALTSVHDVSNMRRAIAEADVVFVGGGNTFRLLKALYDHDLLDPIRRRVAAGAPYIGSSAGSIVACPTLKTTKDMPVVQPPSFEALGLVSFQISPHYLDPDPSSTHMGETGGTHHAVPRGKRSAGSGFTRGLGSAFAGPSRNAEGAALRAYLSTRREACRGCARL